MAKNGNNNYDTQKFNAIVDGSNVAVGQALQHLISKVDANGQNHRGDTLKIIIGAGSIILVLLGMLWSFSGWKRSTEMRTGLLETRVEAGCQEVKIEKEKVWSRFETDRKERQVIKDDVTAIKHGVEMVNASQARMESDVKEIKEAVKK